MKKNIFLIISIAGAILTSCGNGNENYDASGVFEATQVIVSAQSTGQIMQLDITEGQSLEAGKQIGYIDTLQLHLKKTQLLANMTSVESRRRNIPRQTAPVQQQIATQKAEQKRYRNLVVSNAASQKQLDDIDAQIAWLQKQLAAQIETLENNNRSVASESLSLAAQIAQTEDQIRHSIIVSPIRGTVLATYAQPGELATHGRVLFKVADIINMNLRVYVTADQLTSLKIGQPVSVYSDQGKADRKEYPGAITWISDKAEFTPKTIQTRNERANLVYAVKIAVKNDGYIKIGMYGEIKIH